MRPSLSLCAYSRVVRLVTRPHPRHPPINSSLVIFCHCRSNLQLLPTVHTYLEFSQRPVQSSPVQSAIPSPSAGCFRFNCLTIVNLRRRHWVRKLPALPSYHTIQPPPSCVAFASSPPGSVSLIIPRPFLPVIANTTTRFFTVQSLHSTSLSSHSPSTQSASLAWLCAPCCGSAVSWFDFPPLLLSAWDCGPKPTAATSTARLPAQCSAVR